MDRKSYHSVSSVKNFKDSHAAPNTEQAWQRCVNNLAKLGKCSLKEDNKYAKDNL